MDFMRNKLPGNPFSPGDVVECIKGSGALRQGSLYKVDETTTCPCAGQDGGISLVAPGPKGADAPCGWWNSSRFRHAKPEDNDLLEKIKKAKPKIKEMEPA